MQIAHQSSNKDEMQRLVVLAENAAQALRACYNLSCKKDMAGTYEYWLDTAIQVCRELERGISFLENNRNV